GGPERVPQHRTWVAGGWFDRRWRLDDELIIPGDADLRAKSAVLQPERIIDSAELKAYAGSYQPGPDLVVRIRLDGKRLMVRPGSQTEMVAIPTSDGEFCVLEGPVKVSFDKDAAGRVISLSGFQNGQRFSAKKVD